MCSDPLPTVASVGDITYALTAEVGVRTLRRWHNRRANWLASSTHGVKHPQTQLLRRELHADSSPHEHTH